MKSLKIHLIWSVITLVSAVAWGQWLLHSRGDESRERERVLQVKLVEATAARTQTVVVAEPVPAAPTPAVAPAPAIFTAEYAVYPKELLPVEEIRSLLRSGNPADEWQGYRAIENMLPCPLKTELFLEALKCKYDKVRLNALTLVKDDLGAEEAASLIQEILASDPSTSVRDSAAGHLRYRNDPGTTEALLQAFQKDELRVQVSCASVLYDRGLPGPAAQLVPRLAAAMESPDGALRREAAKLLGTLDCPQALPVLVRALGDSNGDVRLEAVDRLTLDDVRIGILLEPLLQDPYESVRDAVKDRLDRLKYDKKE